MTAKERVTDGNGTDGYPFGNLGGANRVTRTDGNGTDSNRNLTDGNGNRTVAIVVTVTVTTDGNRITDVAGVIGGNRYRRRDPRNDWQTA